MPYISVTFLAFKREAKPALTFSRPRLSQNNSRPSKRELTKNNSEESLAIYATFTHHLKTVLDTCSCSHMKQTCHLSSGGLLFTPDHDCENIWQKGNVVIFSQSKLKSTDLPVTVSEGHLGPKLTEQQLSAGTHISNMLTSYICTFTPHVWTYKILM